MTVASRNLGFTVFSCGVGFPGNPIRNRGEDSQKRDQFVEGIRPGGVVSDAGQSRDEISPDESNERLYIFLEMSAKVFAGKVYRFACLGSRKLNGPDYNEIGWDQMRSNKIIIPQANCTL